MFFLIPIKDFSDPSIRVTDAYSLMFLNQSLNITFLRLAIALFQHLIETIKTQNVKQSNPSI